MAATTTDIPIPLPIRPTVREAYGYLWEHRRAFLGQVLIWTLALWLGWRLCELVFSVAWNTIGPPVAGRLIDSAYILVGALSLLGAAGAMLLSFGRGFLRGQTPRAGDALRLRQAGSFWPALAAVWLVLHLLPQVGLHLQQIHGTWPGMAGPVVSEGAARAAYGIWLLAIGPMIALAPPLAAFGGRGRPFREAWRRLQGNRLRMVALAAAMAAAPVALAFAGEVLIVEVWRPSVPARFEDAGAAGKAWDILYGTLSGPLLDALRFLIVLALAAGAVAAHARLSPPQPDSPGRG